MITKQNESLAPLRQAHERASALSPFYQLDKFHKTPKKMRIIFLFHVQDLNFHKSVHGIHIMLTWFVLSSLLICVLNI